MAESDDGFAARWSRRKRGAALPTDEPGQGGAPEAPPATAGVVAGESEPGTELADLPNLPDPDSLDAEADFTVFLKANVPEAIRRRALRRLWRLDPVFANLDGLNDYNGDYTDAATVVAGLKTLYKVGRGFVTDDEDDGAKPDEAGATADTTPGQTAEEPRDEIAGERRKPEPVGEDGANREPQVQALAAASVPRRTAAGPSVYAEAGSRRRALERRWGKPEV